MASAATRRRPLRLAFPLMVALAALPLVTVHAGATYTSSYSFVSAAGDYIGQGASASYTAPSATFGMSGTAGDLTFSVTTSTEWWYVNLAAPIGGQLQSGTTYSNAMRAPFRTGSAPGLDAYGDGRGCNQVYGQFTINQIASDSSGNVILLDAVFTQNCEQPGAPPLQGTVKYRIPTVAATTTALSASPSTASAGTPITLTAAVTPSAGAAPTGTVTFSEAGTPLGSATLDGTGTAAFTTSSLAVGSHSITAAYGGDAGDAPSASAAMSVTVQPDATQTSLSTSSACSRAGQAVTFTATVAGSPAGAPVATGTVRFLDGSTTLGTATLGSGGSTTLTTSRLTVGSHSITAAYGGDAAHSGSTSGTVIETVRKHC